MVRTDNLCVLSVYGNANPSCGVSVQQTEGVSYQSCSKVGVVVLSVYGNANLSSGVSVQQTEGLSYKSCSNVGIGMLYTC